MKKLLIVCGVVAVFFTATAFVTSEWQSATKGESPSIVEDNGWEEYTTVTAYQYRKDRDGEWVSCDGAYRGVEIERREWCGEPEYRAKINSSYYPVSKSPIKKYKYCFYKDGYAAMFDM